MIVTLTVNPAIDRNITVDRLAFEDRAYILSTDETPGGRGINASEVIRSFGGETEAVAPAGGETGERLRRYLEKFGFPVNTVEVTAATRVNLNISDRNGLTVKLNERGNAVTAEELARIEEAVVAKLDRARWLMLCGSLPPGVATDFYARLVEKARASNVLTLLDTSGEALELGLEAKPTVVAPNQPEAEHLLNKGLLTRMQFLEAAERIRLMGSQWVVLSLGSRGAVGAEEGRVVEAIPPRVDAVSPIGAGDALAASFVWSMHEGRPFDDCLRWGVAAGTASAMLPGLNFASLEETKRIYDQVQMRVNPR